MPALIFPGVVLVLAATASGFAFEARSPAGLPHPGLLLAQEQDEACEAAIESQVWEDVVEFCEPLLLDESHPDWDFFKENVDYAHQTIAYALQTQCVESAQASDWDTTLSACPPTVDAFPDFLAGHLFLGFAHQAKGDAELATGSFENFLAAADANPEMAAQLGEQIALAQKNVAISYLAAGKRVEAIPLLREVAAKDPTDAESSFRLGFALLQEKDTEGAEEAFSTVIALDPDIPQLPQVLHLAGQLNFNAGDYAKADERLSRYLELEPDGERAADSHYMLGFIAGRDEDQSRMVGHYRSAVEGAPDDPRAKEANYSLGVITFNRNQCNSAQRYFTRFLRLAGNDSRRADVEDMLLDIEDGLCEPAA